MKKYAKQSIIILGSAMVLGLFYNTVSQNGIDLTYNAVSISDQKIISLYEMKKVYKNNSVTVIDARSIYQYKKGHIPGSINIIYSLPADQVAEKLTERTKTDNLIIYCYSATCNQANVLANKIKKLGYENIVVFKDGFSVWKKAGYPINNDLTPLKK